MKKIIVLSFVICLLAIGASAVTAACQSCNVNNAQCVNAQFGGCRCQQFWSPDKQRVVCAYCGFCLTGCLYSCGGGHGAAVPIDGLSASTTTPAWITNIVLVSRVRLQSDRMATLVEVVQEQAKKDECNMLRGTMIDHGKRVTWSSVRTRTGGVTILSSYGRTLEQVFIEDAGWGLARNGKNLVQEKLQ
jgi:hypothetical protein